MNQELANLVKCIISPRWSLTVGALALSVGCSSIPKAEVNALRVDCPNVRSVKRVATSDGTALAVRIKGASNFSLELDSARALKSLVASTNLRLARAASGTSTFIAAPLEYRDSIMLASTPSAPPASTVGRSFRTCPAHK